MENFRDKQYKVYHCHAYHCHAFLSVSEVKINIQKGKLLQSKFN